MVKKKEATPEAGQSSELFQRLAALKGQTGSLDIEGIDARLLFKVVTILARRRASIQIGVTQDGSAWAVQYWDGKIPVKDYHRATADFNSSLAALIRAEYGNQLTPEWNEIIMEYGW